MASWRPTLMGSLVPSHRSWFIPSLPPKHPIPWPLRLTSNRSPNSLMILSPRSGTTPQTWNHLGAQTWLAKSHRVAQKHAREARQRHRDSSLERNGSVVETMGRMGCFN
ncbi:hypothetical protein K438DRAFT_1807546 [Mycena galopus ATCC 62051]|nr:hypothetical protein K438DRAFT_1807546 [Mycena galopus ATCC 62051]